MARMADSFELRNPPKPHRRPCGFLLSDDRFFALKLFRPAA
jgi:hypothetical protein